MSESTLREPRQFGKRNEPKTVSISSNGSTRQFSVNPIFFVLSLCVFCTFMVGYLGSTAYLAFRDDLIASSFVRQARIKHEYEDRIAALRSKVDKITSRQLLDQQAVEAQVGELMKQQELLNGRSGELNGLLERANQSGVNALTIPVPSANPLNGQSNSDPMTTGSIKPQAQFKTAFADTFLRGSSENTSASGFVFKGENVASGNALHNKRVFGSVREKIKQIKSAQFAKLLNVQQQAQRKGAEIAKVMQNLGIPVSAQSMQNIGGPYEPARADASFETIAERLQSTLGSLDQLKIAARKAPISSPLPNSPISSLFGNRTDPFNRRTAFHAGIDFRAGTGTPIKATGSGVVTKASRNGGYGLMVIIDHGNGLTTRYAHMSRIMVKVGQTITKGKTIGKVGSTGRSTGPHLHYELRRNGKAINPSSFIKAGKKLAQIL